MIKYALFASFEAKPGKEADVAQFLQQGLEMANQEADTPIWFALKLSDSVFGIFDAFETEEARQAHLNGPIAQALMAKANELFTDAPLIASIEVLGMKNKAAAS
jgi:quinol monooxygenase YgiN